MKTTKEEICKTANRLYQQRGFDNVTVDDICENLSITKGSFYHHYKSKYEPLLDELAHKINAPQAFLVELFDIPENKEKLWKLFKWGFIDLYENISRGEIAKIWMANILLGDKGITPYSVYKDKGESEYIDLVYAIIERGQKSKEVKNNVSPKELLFTLMCAGIGASITWSSTNVETDFETEMRKVFDAAIS